jgi:hypothetical protein
MTLGELITRLESEDPARSVMRGFDCAHSYRGFYDQLAFRPQSNVSIGDMLAEARSAVGTVYSGYKGGEFLMSRDTTVWLAQYGNLGEEIGPNLIRMMLGDPVEEASLRLAQEALAWYRRDKAGTVMPTTLHDALVALDKVSP